MLFRAVLFSGRQHCFGKSAHVGNMRVGWLLGKQSIILGILDANLTCRAWSPGWSRWLVTLKKISLHGKRIFPIQHVGFLIKRLETPALLCFGFCVLASHGERRSRVLRLSQMDLKISHYG